MFEEQINEIKSLGRKFATDSSRVAAKKLRPIFETTGFIPEINTPAIRILTFHSVIENNWHPISCDPAVFDKMMEIVSSEANPISIDDLHSVLTGKIEFPEKGVLVTFDDGYTDNLTEAAPILAKYNVPALVFVTLSHLDEPWEIDPDLGRHYLDRKTLVELSKHDQITIGSHCMTHQNVVQNRSSNDKSHELKDSKIALEKILNKEISYFSFPFGGIGDYDEESLQIVENTYKLGFLNRGGAIFKGTDYRFSALPRFHVSREDTPNDIREIVSGNYDLFDAIYTKLRHPKSMFDKLPEHS